MKKRLVTGLVILIVAAGAILGYVLIKGGKEEAPKYRIETLGKGDIEAVVTTSGTINPIDIVDVGSQVSGKITKLYVDYNSEVKAGQVVAELDQEILKSKVDQDDSSYRSRLASLEQAKVNLENAKKKNERTQDLFKRDLVSFEEKETAEANYVGAKVSLQNAEASVSQAKSQLDSSKINLAYATIRSPIDGTVIDRPVNVGQTVAASMSAPVLVKIASDLKKMRVQCSVDEADIGKVKEGQKVRFTVDAFPGEQFTGVVMQVRYAAVTTQNVVTYTTIVNAENPDLKLRPGMTATVSIITGEARGVLRVANGALRFTPELKKEEMDKLLAEMRERLGAQRGERGGSSPAQPGGSPVGASGAQTPGAGATEGRAQGGERGARGTRGEGNRAFQFGEGQQITPEMMARFQQMRQSARRTGQVWVQADDGTIKPYFVRTGLADSTNTEITGGELKEGLKVIVGFLSATSTATTQQGPGGMRGGPGQMMFIR